MNNLTVNQNRQDLFDLIETVFEGDNSSEEMKQIYNAAVAVLNNPNSTDEEIVAAINSLQVIPSENVPNNSTENTGVPWWAIILIIGETIGLLLLSNHLLLDEFLFDTWVVVVEWIIAILGAAFLILAGAPWWLSCIIIAVFIGAYLGICALIYAFI